MRNGRNKSGKHEYSAEVAMHRHDQDHDTHHMESVCASEQDGGLTITFVQAETPLQAAVAQYFGN
jgi:hypothetical protein